MAGLFAILMTSMAAATPCLGLEGEGLLRGSAEYLLSDNDGDEEPYAPTLGLTTSLAAREGGACDTRFQAGFLLRRVGDYSVDFPEEPGVEDAFTYELGVLIEPDLYLRLMVADIAPWRFDLEARLGPSVLFPGDVLATEIQMGGSPVEPRYGGNFSLHAGGVWSVNEEIGVRFTAGPSWRQHWVGWLGEYTSHARYHRVNARGFSVSIAAEWQKSEG